MKIGVIGAGITGLSVAQDMVNKGHIVEVFEKSRGVGGRMSTRRTDYFSFDHGAQCFTARTKQFQGFVRKYENLGLIKEWSGKVISLEKGKEPENRLWFETHWVACPTMNSLCKKLAEELNVKKQTEISEIVKKNGKWQLITKDNESFSDFDWIISTAPPIQTHNLMPDIFKYKDDVSQINMDACFALMLGFKHKIETKWIAAKPRNSILKWITINSKRPDRNSEVTSIQIHARDNWSNDNSERDFSEIQTEMIKEFKELTGIDGNLADYASTHRWLYSLVSNTSKNGAFIDFENHLAACGDWCLTSRIEEAWLSGQKVVKEISRAG